MSPHQKSGLHLRVIHEIGEIINVSEGLENILDGIVWHLSSSLGFDVVSVYLWNEEESKLILRASRGLHFDPDSPPKMTPDEGLTGLVFRTRNKVSEKYASKHPNFKHFKGIGESKYQSYLGVPILLKNKCLGILVGQYKEAKTLHDAEETLFEIIASRIAGMLPVAQDIGKLRKKQSEIGNEQTHISGKQGRGVSAGFAVGKIHLVRGIFRNLDLSKLAYGSLREEMERLENAFLEAEKDLQKLIENLKNNPSLSSSDIRIFEAHIFLLRDPEFRKPILASLESQKTSAEDAVQTGIQNIIKPFESSPVSFLQEKVHDFKELGERLIQNLLQKEKGSEQIEPGSILVAYEAGPSLLSSFAEGQVAGIVTEAGGAASHLAIMARGMGLPAVSGLKNICELVQNGDRILIDGRSGFVFPNPSKDLVELYTETEKRKGEISKQLAQGGQDLSACQFPVHIEASLGLPSEVDHALEQNLKGVGLFRSEFVFMQAAKWPTVDEQYHLYKNIASSFTEEVTVRTLDIGGDKSLPYHQMAQEENPLLGMRSIRFSMEHQDHFREQLQALIRTWKEYSQLRILLPMISSLWEVEAARDLLEQVCEEENIPKGQFPKLGVMAEVPGILYQIENLAKHADFFSLGTNDLVQYLLAVDRNSSTVEHLYSEAHPSVLAFLNDFKTKCSDWGMQVTVCGEMAGTLPGVLSLLSLGYRNFSVRPEQAPAIRFLCNKINPSILDDLRATILSESSARNVDKILQRTLEEIDPLLALSD